jgi:uncharacterized protein (DUF486 family)
LSSDEELMRKARMRAYAKLGFYIHFGVYIGVNVMLFFIWWFTRDNTAYPYSSFPWFIFIIVGWGIGVVAHYLGVFARTGVTDRMTQKEYQKLKGEQEQH